MNNILYACKNIQLGDIIMSFLWNTFYIMTSVLINSVLK